VGGWTCYDRWQFPAGCLPRRTVDGRCIADAYTYVNSYSDRDSNGNRSTESDTYGHSYSYTDFHANCDT
jgi:hypothetical protein